MRKIQHRPPFTSVFTNKRFVVACCAAIAMVLGAMSVGARGPSPDDTAAVPIFPAANRAGSLVREDSRQDRGEANTGSQASTSRPLKRPYLDHRSPVLVTPQRKNAASTADPKPADSPSKTLEVKLNITPLEVSITVPSKQPSKNDGLLNASLSENGATVEVPPLQGAAAAAGGALQAILEPDPESSPNAPEQQGL